MFLHLGTVKVCQAHANFLWGVLKFAPLLAHVNNFTAKFFNALHKQSVSAEPLSLRPCAWWRLPPQISTSQHWGELEEQMTPQHAIQ